MPRVLLFCLLLGCAFQLQAQQLVKTFDSGLWTGLKIDYKPLLSDKKTIKSLKIEAFYVLCV